MERSIKRTLSKSIELNRTIGSEHSKNKIGTFEWMESHFVVVKECVVHMFMYWVIACYNTWNPSLPWTVESLHFGCDFRCHSTCIRPIVSIVNFTLIIFILLYYGSCNYIVDFLTKMIFTQRGSGKWLKGPVIGTSPHAHVSFDLQWGIDKHSV